ncbi:MAG TPA: hypothetical protein VIV11_13075 [Kofleriaceae bacterium]
MGRADAGRKRLVVLDFEGPKAEKFHSDVVKLVKKSHTVLTVDKWNEKADELDAAAVTDKNIKKVAKKLKIDGVITGKIEKRRDEYIIRLKLRGGSTGETVGNPVQTKAEGPRIDAQAQRDIKDELMPAIDELDSVRGGDEEEEEEEEDAPKKKKNGDDEEEEEEESGGFVKKGKMKAEEEEDPKAAKKRKAEEEKRKKAEAEEAKRLAKEEETRKKKEDEARKKEEAAALAASKKKKKTADEEEEEEEEDTKKRASADDEEEEEEETDTKSKKRTASADDEEEDDSISDSADVDSSGGRDLSVAGRALDAVVGMSFTARTLKFAYQGDLAKPPPGYKQSIPVTGGLIDVTFYPMSFSKGSKGIIRGIGLNVLYDRVLLINSQKKYSDDQGVQRIADLKTAENRWAIGAVLRYPLGKMVVGGSLSYGRQQFSVQQTLPNMDATDIPNVHYTMITPAGFLRYPVTPKITANADLAFHAITNTGQIQKTGMDGYGAATVTGFELEAGADYMVTKNIFARASIRYETIGFKFKGDPTSQSNIRDTDPEQDVSGARDTYFGGTATVGYVY